jgi:hypothetical protein
VCRNDDIEKCELAGNQFTVNGSSLTPRLTYHGLEVYSSFKFVLSLRNACNHRVELSGNVILVS